jgi:hypothetical protein
MRYYLFICIVLIVLQLPIIHSHFCFLVRIPTCRHPTTELRFTIRDYNKLEEKGIHPRSFLNPTFYSLPSLLHFYPTLDAF